MTYNSEVVADSPVIQWKLDDVSGGPQDSSGNGYHATGVYAGTYGEPSLVDAGTAMLCPVGSTKGVYYGATVAPLFLTSGVQQTVEMWIKTTQTAVAQLAYQSGGSSFDLRMNTTAGKLTLKWASFPNSITSSATVNDGLRHHIVATITATTVTLYVDKVSQGTMARGGNADAAPSIIHGFDSGVGAPFEGTLDEIAWYTTALSAARVTAHYDAGAPPPAEATATLAGTLQSKTAAFTLSLDTPASATLAGTLQGKTGAFTLYLETPAVATLAGTLQGRTAVFTVMGEPSVSLAGVLQRRTAQITVLGEDPGAVRARLVGTLQPRIATFTMRAEIDVVPAPAGFSAGFITAQAFGPVTIVGSQPSYTVSQERTARSRQRMTVDGVDVTFFRGVNLPGIGYSLQEPLLYGPSVFTLPQVAAAFETPGVGALSWLRPGAVVEIERVIDDVVVAIDYKGVLVAYEASGNALTIEVGGEVMGRAALRNRQTPLFPRVNDLGHQMADSVRDLGMPFYPPLGPVTGIEGLTFGGEGHLDNLLEIIVKAWTLTGGHWTVMPDEATGVYEAHVKDTTTIHGTVFADDARTVANLRRDIAEEPNRIFASGITPAGKRVRFGVYPGLIQGKPPPFPGHMQFGDTGDGVRILIDKLHSVGYLKLVQAGGGYDADVVLGVLALQEDAGLNETGEVNEATWRALYDQDVTGMSLEYAHIEPAAQRKKVRPWNRAGSGQILSVNEDYDTEVLPRDRNIDIGVGFNRSQIRRFAQTELYDSDSPNWVGDITFYTGALVRGDKPVGTILTEADVMDALDLRPGMNLRLPLFAGGIVVHVSAVDVGADGTVGVTVDTRARDAMEVWEVIARNVESRNDPARHRQRQARSSTVQKDSIGEWDEIGGLLGNDVELDAGWNVFPVVAAAEGTISRIRLIVGNTGTRTAEIGGEDVEVETIDGCEFACAVFGRTVDVDRLNNLVPQPLTVNGGKAWENKETRKALNERWLLYAAGTSEEPCGYSPGKKHTKEREVEEPNPDYDPATDSDSDKTRTVTVTESWGTVTGRHSDDAGFAYRSNSRTELYIAVWVRPQDAGKKVQAGRLLWPQLEAGV